MEWNSKNFRKVGGALSESKEKLHEELKKIEEWEKDQKDVFFWEKIGRVPFMILDKLTPKFIHEKINSVVDEIAIYIENGGQYILNQESILKKASAQLNKETITLEEMQTIPLHEMDRLSAQFLEQRKKTAKIQGATTGIGGLFTLAIDVPLVLGMSLKTLQETAISYGYDATSQEERLFMIKCMQFTSSDIVGKKAILDELTNPNNDKSISQIQGWREVLITYTDQFGWKKLFQMIPIAGMIFGAYMNKQAIADIGEVGSMLYKKRRINERLADL